MTSVLFYISSSEWLDNRWSPKKGEGDKYTPKANTFILSESVFHISNLNKRAIVCWTPHQQ